MIPYVSPTFQRMGGHLPRLEEVGSIAVNKAFVERKLCTFDVATGEGREAFQEHVAALVSILKSK